MSLTACRTRAFKGAAERSLLLFLLILLLGVSFAPRAEAQTSCSYTGAPTNLLTVTESEFFASVEIRRKGSEIVVGEFLEPPTRCSGGVPTVLNTDTILVLLEGGADAELRLAGGPFAPGATPEPVGAPEIEIEFFGGFGTVVGTPRADEFHWGPGGAHAGLNLNPRSAGDLDVDVTLRSAFALVVAKGGSGNDRIIPGPGGVSEGVLAMAGQGNDRLVAPRNTDSILEGGPGNDLITGGSKVDLLSGGAGDDRVAGGAGDDAIDGERGHDLLLGGRGRDEIESRDGMRDRVRCGSGRDRVHADRRDRLRGCEVKRRPSR